MNGLKLAATALVLAALAGCASEPSWNSSQFPQQPEYGVASAQASK